MPDFGFRRLDEPSKSVNREKRKNRVREQGTGNRGKCRLALSAAEGYFAALRMTIKGAWGRGEVQVLRCAPFDFAQDRQDDRRVKDQSDAAWPRASGRVVARPSGTDSSSVTNFHRERSRTSFRTNAVCMACPARSATTCARNG